MASIKKIGENSYRIRVSNGYLPNGNQKYESMVYHPSAKEGTKKLEKELQKAALDFEKSVKEGEIFDGEKITFQSFFATWITDYAEKNLKQRVKELYIKEIEMYVLPVLGSMKIAKIKVGNCQKVVSAMQNNDLASSSIRHVKTAMNSVFKYAVNMEVIENNPVTNIIIPKGKKTTKAVILTVDQTKEFLDCLKWEYPVKYGKRKRTDSNGNEYNVNGYQTTKTIPYQFQVYFNLAVFSGCRREELIALTWKDINFEKQMISINKAVVKTKKYGQTIEETKTESSNRDLYMPYNCMHMLQVWKDQQRELCYTLSNKWEGLQPDQFDDQFIFIQSTGRRMDIYTPYNRLQNIIKDHNELISSRSELIPDLKEKEKLLSRLLPHIRLHDLRHCSASLLISEGVNIASVSKRLGHSQISTTLDVYTHSFPERDKEASDMLEKALKGDIKPMIHMETVKVSNDERMLLERLRNTDSELQELIMDMLNGNYSQDEMVSIVQANKTGTKRS